MIMDFVWPTLEKITCLHTCYTAGETFDLVKPKFSENWKSSTRRLALKKQPFNTAGLFLWSYIILSVCANKP